MQLNQQMWTTVLSARTVDLVMDFSSSGGSRITRFTTDTISTTIDCRQEFAKRMQDLKEYRGLPQLQRIVTKELNFT